MKCLYYESGGCCLWSKRLEQGQFALPGGLSDVKTPLHLKAGRKQKGKMHQGCYWPLYGEQDEIVFAYTATRAHRCVQDIIGDDFSGTLLSDGYAAYDLEYGNRHLLIIH